MKINWLVRNADGSSEKEGEWEEPGDSIKIPEVESKVFKKVADVDFEAKYLLVRGRWGGRLARGAGFVAHYEKQHETWVRGYCNNIVPTWFPFFFFGLIVLVFGVLIGMAYFGVIPW
jgi:hypothetical protein